MNIIRNALILIGAFISVYGSLRHSLDVHFFAKNHFLKAVKQSICHKNNWQLTIPQQVADALKELKFYQDTYGMISDGRFAVPVQKDYSNFKRSPTIGATGGNQRFFFINPFKTRGALTEVIGDNSVNISIKVIGNLRDIQCCVESSLLIFRHRTKVLTDI